MLQSMGVGRAGEAADRQERPENALCSCSDLF